MTLRILTCATPLMVFTAGLPAAPVSGLYEITSGRFGTWTGWGAFEEELPSPEQTYIELLVHGNSDAELRLRGAHMQPWDVYDPWVFFPPSPPHAFSEGSWDGTGFVFDEILETFWGTGELAYHISFSGDEVLLNGDLTITRPSGFDGPTYFYHADVRATLVPEPASLALLISAAGLMFCARRAI